MNRMLKLKGKFNQKSKTPNFGPPRMKSGVVLSSVTVRKVIKDLEKCDIYWKDITLIKGALISIEYVDIVDGSNYSEEDGVKKYVFEIYSQQIKYFNVGFR